MFRRVAAVDGGCSVDAASSRLRTAGAIRAGNGGSRRTRTYGSCDGETAALREGALVMAAATESLLGARGQRKPLSFMERDYEDTRSKGQDRRRSVRVRGGCRGLASGQGQGGAESRRTYAIGVCEISGAGGGLWRRLVGNDGRCGGRAGESTQGAQVSIFQL